MTRNDGEEIGHEEDGLYWRHELRKMTGLRWEVVAWEMVAWRGQLRGEDGHGRRLRAFVLGGWHNTDEVVDGIIGQQKAMDGNDGYDVLGRVGESGEVAAVVGYSTSSPAGDGLNDDGIERGDGRRGRQWKQSLVELLMADPALVAWEMAGFISSNDGGGFSDRRRVAGR